MIRFYSSRCHSWSWWPCYHA